jgi:hypothetical protein
MEPARPRPSVRLAALCLAGALAACAGANTRLTRVETPNVVPGKPTRVLVVGFTAREDLRRLYEDDMSGRLRALGLQAVESLEALPPGARLDRPTLTEAVQRTGADAVIVARLAADREQTRSVGGPAIAGFAAAPFYGPFGFYDYYLGAWPYVYGPAYLETERVVTLETRLYRAEGDGVLVWRGLTDTFDPGTARAVVRAVDEKVLRRMREDGVI